MILALRQRHRRMFAVIGILVPIAFAIGIAARKPVPSVASLPAGLADSSQVFSNTEWERGDLFPKNSIQVRLLRERAGAGRFAVSFSAPKDFAKPDLIVYWVAGSPTITDTLPDNARLLGAFGSSALALPAEAFNSDGVIVLFSLADNEIVDASKPFDVRKMQRETAAAKERGSPTRSTHKEQTALDKPEDFALSEVLRLGRAAVQ